MNFLSPDSAEFIDGIHENFYKNYLAAYCTQPPELKITLLEKDKKVVTQYKDIWLTGYNCTLKVSAPSEALEFIYNCGLGERNSQGFGLVKII
jgi:CRISPR-associated endoribonuclease Cas6